MALIDLQNISKTIRHKSYFKRRKLYSSTKGQNFAVISQNGQGKSTLFKIIMKTVEPDGGEMAIDRSIKIEMLDQQPKFETNLTVRNAIENQLVELKMLELNMKELQMNLPQTMKMWNF